MKHQTKPTVMILGSHHLAGWDGDNIDDMRAPKRQRELQQLADQLAQFQPTKIAVEVDHLDSNRQQEYNAYLKDDFQLERHEVHQVGFRLAKMMGHPKIHCVDHFRNAAENPIFGRDPDDDLTDYYKFAKTHGQEHLLRLPSTKGKTTQDEDGTTQTEPEYEPIIDMYIRLNQPERIHSNHQKYLRNARIGSDDQYPGANWMGYFWYPRNLKTYVNLTRITESADDRILLIIGAAHTFLIQQFLEDSGDYIVESPLDYLSAEETQ